MEKMTEAQKTAYLEAHVAVQQHMAAAAHAARRETAPPAPPAHHHHQYSAVGSPIKVNTPPSPHTNQNPFTLSTRHHIHAVIISGTTGEFEHRRHRQHVHSSRRRRFGLRGRRQSATESRKLVIV